MKIKRNVEIPKNIGNSALGETSLALLDFVDSDDVNMKYECEDKREASRIYSTASGTARRMKLPVRITRSMNDVYVIREDK